MLKIITGRFKGSNLYSVPGFSTRPATSFQREQVFSMIPDFEGKRVLDLFAGTGSYGLEALSRGASWVDFVEFSSPAIAVLLKNIQKLKCGNECHVHRRRTEDYIKKTTAAYDVIIMDPPYNKGLVNLCLQLIFDSQLPHQGLTIIIEHSVKEKLEPLFEQKRTRHKEGKVSAVSILEIG